jgi:DNA (cytosine-5)-methyltransferase 1
MADKTRVLKEKNYELVNFCEFDKYATKSYCAVHGVDESLNLGDITKVDENNLKPFTMICGGSPCQDFSISGKQAGSMWKCKDCQHEYNPLTVHFSTRDKCPNCGSCNLDKTRSSLLVEWLRIIRANKPKWGIYENVKNIVGKKFKETFDMFINELHEYGYNTYWQVLNAKNYGIPQNRERVYLIIIKKELDNGQFKFPEPFDNGVRFKDVTEDSVEEKYYVNTPKANELIETLINSGKLEKDISNTVKTGGARKHRPTSMGYGSGIKTGLFSKQCSQFDKEIDVANTLLARDYKGFGNQAMNGVIQYQNK